MNTEFRKQLIKDAGGSKTVSEATKKSGVTVWKWVNDGFPLTEWTGETNYTEIIASLTKYTRQEILDKGR